MYSLTGPPGSGKSTHIESLRQEGWQSVSAGQLLRTKAPAAILDEMNRGQLANHDYTNSLIAAALDELLAQYPTSSIISDGYPRAVVQARWLLEDYGMQMQACIVLQAPDERLIQHLVDRGRSDDQPASIRERIAIFKENIGEVLAYYEQKQVPVHFVSADQTLEQTLADIRKVLELDQ